jgi:hypothetical protein
MESSVVTFNGGKHLRFADRDSAFKKETLVQTTQFEISCREVRREISNYLDEEIPAELTMRIDRHIARCSGCRALFDGTRNVLELVSTGEVFPLPPKFSSRLFLKLNNSILQ